MPDLSPQHFFDLAAFHHATLFQQTEFVWEALLRIKTYLEQALLGSIEGAVDDRAYLVAPGRITIGKGSVVEPGAYIKGPCIIGEDCTIRHGAYVRGDVIVGDRCVIGHDTEIKHSILLDGAQAAHFAYVGDSILGNGVNLGAGTKCANLRLDGSNIVVDVQGERVATEMRKFGAIIGDRAQLGCNCVTNPGTLMGPESSSLPCTNFGGFVARRQRVCAGAPPKVKGTTTV